MTKQFEKNQLKQAETKGNKEQIVQGEEGSKKMAMQSKKQFKNQSQSGRSMVEMLGVLAIIAILSIGGIVGFRLAMNYYQANQIAHEINLMRTDAQIKIAQGTEKLMLGEPYDPLGESTLGHIQFNDAYPVDFACALADDEAVELSNISCHVANAYYIELQNIPEGVCKPLAELVNGMNNIIAFDVNKNEYPETGKCEAGNRNVLNAVFSAEAVSELKVCTEDTDCESENALYCDPSRHVCVKCYEDNQCEHNQYCEDNTCVTCESGVWNGEECVECTADDDCTDTPDTPVCNTEEYKCVECLTYSDCTDTPETPQCDDESHTCKSCIDIDSSKPVWADTQCVECTESTDCEESLVCRENTCSPCETEDECQAKGENYHCSKESTCIQCLDNQVWDDESRECVECTEDNDCADTPDTPKCNTTTNQCVECIESSNCSAELVCRENECTTCQTEDECQTKGTTYHCSKEDTCIQCAANQVWGGKDKGCVECLSPADCKNPEKQLCDTTTNTCIECETNAQCAEKGKDPHCHKATHTCEPCPDGSHNKGNACVLSIDTIPFFYTPNLGDHVIACQKLTPHHFGPYTHAYELWVKGTFDDYIQFYVNEELPNISTTEPTYEGCDDAEFKERVNCADHGAQGCSTYLSDSHLGTLNVGDFGNLTIQTVNVWMSWGGTGRDKKLTNDAAAWLVLGDE